MKITYRDHMGTDLTPADVARVSFNKRAEDFPEEKNNKLTMYLAKHDHWTPLAHIQLQLHVKIPIFLARQYFKHIVGSVKNEVSRRYIDTEPEFWLPKKLRKRPDKGIKQGSGEEFNVLDSVTLEALILNNSVDCLDTYRQLINTGVAPELARIVLPQNTYTEFIDTGSLVYWARMYNQRTKSNAQKDWEDIMEQLNNICMGHFPVSWEALTTKEPT